MFFSKTDEKAYLGSELERLIRKFELFFKETIEKSVFLSQISTYISFLSKFLALSSEKKAVSLNFSLIVLRLRYSQNENSKKQLFLEPSSLTVMKSLINPLEMLLDTVNSLGKLDKNLFPLISLKFRPAFPVSREFEEFKRAVLWIKENLQKHLKYFIEIY